MRILGLIELINSLCLTFWDALLIERQGLVAMVGSGASERANAVNNDICNIVT